MGLDDILNKGGEEIRHQATNRKCASNNHTETPRKLQSSEDSYEEYSERLAEHALSKHASSEKKFKLYCDRLDLEKSKEEVDEYMYTGEIERLTRMERFQERRQELDYERLQMDKD